MAPPTRFYSQSTDTGVGTFNYGSTLQVYSQSTDNGVGTFNNGSTLQVYSQSTIWSVEGAFRLFPSNLKPNRRNFMVQN